jgi:hypothetical protein
MAKTEMVYDEFCPWPFYQPYGMVEVVVKKPPRKRKPRRRSAAKALALPIFRQKVIPNKKRQNDRSKVTLGGDE